MGRVRMRLLVGMALLSIALVLGACGSSDDGDKGSASATTRTIDANKKVTLTIWGWDPTLKAATQAYMAAHPNVTIKTVNAGSGIDEYTKFRNAIKAGTGAPDIVMVEWASLSQFVVDGSLVDLAKNGIDPKVQDAFAPWYIQILSAGTDGVYGLPLDAGLMSYMYRADLFKKYNLQPPKTWAEFAQTAKALHAKEPNTYLTPFTISYEYFTTLAMQAGYRPFDVDGDKIKIDIANPSALKVAAYWDDLIKSDAVWTGAQFNNAWFSAMNRGTFSGMIGAEWLPVLIKETSKTYGKWRAAPLPQWNAGEKEQAILGGSAYSVSKQSKEPQVAADVVRFITSDADVVKKVYEATPYAFYPVKSLYETDAWREDKLDFYGGQKANEVFGEAAANMKGDLQSSPFQDYVNTQGDALFGTAIKNKSSLQDALKALQSKVVEYAKQQGFTVVQ